MDNRQKQIVLVAITIGIIVIISFIYYSSGNSNINSSVIDCIAERSKLYISSTCGHCAQQKQILGDNLNKFEVVDCSENRQECSEVGVRAVPTWVINGRNYLGVRSINQLKQLAGCENA